MEAPKILLVEDEVLIQEILLARMEKPDRHRHCRDANQAIAELDAGADRFKAVVTDIKRKRALPTLHRTAMM